MKIQRQDSLMPSETTAVDRKEKSTVRRELINFSPIQAAKQLIGPEQLIHRFN
jgi:hypothetical protein